MLEFHHVGELVEDIDAAILSYKLLFGERNISEKFYISSQGVNVCFVNVGNNGFIEIIQPCNENTRFNKMFKKGISYYHVAYLSDNFDKIRETLCALNYKNFNEFSSEAFKDSRCQFFYSPEGHLIELIEK